MDKRTCLGCDTEITPGTRERNKRMWCTPACRARAKYREGKQSVYAPRSTVRIIECQYCNNLFVARSANAKNVCREKRCAQAHREAIAPECKEDGCTQKAWSRGLCAPHYSYWHRAQKKCTITCLVCEKTVQVARANSKCCSRACASRLGVKAQQKTTEIVHAPHLRDTRGKHVIAPRVWTAGSCAYCGTNFIAPGGVARYCSTKCVNNASFMRRYRSRGDFIISRVERLAIYERDGWICQLCFKPVDKSLHHNDNMAASLDHIECQSWTLIPDHSPANLRLAHRLCNSIRQDQPDQTKSA